MNKLVDVRFTNNSYTSSYTYRIPEYLEGQLRIGNLVIVPSTGSNFGYDIVKVVRFPTSSNISPLKEIVCIVDDSHYKSKIVAAAKRKELERKLKERHKKLMEDSWLEDLKRLDPESLNLIRELESLNA